MENNTYSDELQHWGIKGMKWGVRRYQNSDGTLTKAGQKRYQNADGTLTKAGQKKYNKEVAKLKEETAKVKEAEKAAANNTKTQNKFQKLEEKKQALEERKEALKNGKVKGKEGSEETAEQRKERLLKSVDAKELYKHKDELSTFELNERINRIDTEVRLKSKIVEEYKKTGSEYMDDTKNKLDKATNLFRSVDNAYSTVTNSAIGKTLAKKLGIEPPKEERDSPIDFMKKAINGKKTNKEIKEYYEAQNDLDKLQELINKPKREAEKKAERAAKAEAAKAKEEAEKQAKKEAEKQAKEAAKVEEQRHAAQKQVDDYNERWQKGDSDDKVTSKNDSSANAAGQRDTTKSYRIEDTHTERVNTDGNIYGLGKSKFTGWDKKVTDIDAEEGEDFWSVSSSIKNTPTSNLPSTEVYSVGRSYLFGTSKDDD